MLRQIMKYSHIFGIYECNMTFELLCQKIKALIEPVNRWIYFDMKKRGFIRTLKKDSLNICGD